MRNFFLILSFVFIVTEVNSQYKGEDLLNEKMEVAYVEGNAKYSRTVTADFDNGYQVTVHFLDGNKKMTGYYLDSELTTAHGHFVFYYKNGVKESEGLYHMGNKTGTWRRWKLDGEERAYRYYSDESADEIAHKYRTTPAEFPGGHEGLANYISENLTYPEEAIIQKIEGEVIVAFNISTSGDVENVTIYESANYFLDKEALRLVFDMPQWTPAIRRGQNVISKFILPLTFRLPNHHHSDQ